MLITKILFLIVSLGWTTSIFAQAKQGIFLQTGILYYTQALKTPATATKESTNVSRKTLNINALGGYSMANGLALGLKYYNESADDNWKFSNSSTTSKTETSALGPAAGFQLGNFAAFGSYLVLQAPEKTVGNEKYYGGDGYIFDVLYLINMGGWSFGPQVSLINLKYKKHDVNSSKIALDPEMIEEYLYPYFSFFVQL